MLLWVNVQVALVMFGTLGLAYLIIFLTQRRYLRRIGEERLSLAVRRYQNLIQMFNGIKTVQVFGKDTFFTERYEEASRAFCDMQPRYHTTVAAPRYILEVLAFSAIVAVTIYLYLTVGDIANIVPTLSLYAVAGYRLLPALQSAFAAVGKLVHNYPVVDKLHAAFFAGRQASVQPETAKKEETAALLQSNGAPQKPGGTIRLQEVTFTYENNETPTLKNIDFAIHQGETVAFVGATGSGKTTIVDLIVGLLQPTSGNIKIDDAILSDLSLAAWRQNIAYVPQDVFLFDDTVARNITLKEALTPAEENRLREAAQMADIDTFIVNEMTKGYQTEIGERGVRLSGGQRQRLGLARAFFHQPAVLVLDEATSA
ncbi:MAG: ABC transporter ATP-binding protein, partial [Bacteroidota bacterium]